MDINSKQRFGHASPGGYQRSIGMKIASGEYIAFLDDDDYWLPSKIEKQIAEMDAKKCMMSCTDAYTGKGKYDLNQKYDLYNRQKYYGLLKNKYSRNGIIFEDSFPKIWDEKFMSIHNCCIVSSVIIARSLVDSIGYFNNDLWAPDYEYWKRAIKHTDCVYFDEPLVYYDFAHGSGQNY